MTARTFLVLGRVSNLPTVWTNALAGAVLAGASDLPLGPILGVLAALTLFYVGGMYLNDAFDAEIDAAERANRPIPTGQISRRAVFVLGSVFLGAGVVLGFLFDARTGLAGIGLAGAVVLYDWLHKKTALSPLLMGACRILSYVFAALALGDLDAAVVIGGLGLFAHVVGLTYAAKQEAYDRIGNLWPLGVMLVPLAAALWLLPPPLPFAAIAWVAVVVYAGWTIWALRFLFRRGPGDVPRAVVSLIAGISLYDAVMIAAMGAGSLAVLAIAAFGLTLVLQRVVPGT